LMSFHGIPQEYFTDGDPYHCECQKTGRLLAEELQLEKSQWLLTFQSRLGPKQWLKPYTDESLKQLGAEGIQSLDVICPGFSTDCLETLEEMVMENRNIFMAAGGQQYSYIDCLNASSQHISTLQKIAQNHIQGWNFPPTEVDLVERQGHADSIKG
jgi:ferrochelatase